MGSAALVKSKVTLSPKGTRWISDHEKELRDGAFEMIVEPKMDRDLIVCKTGDAPDCYEVVNLGRITSISQAPSNCVEIATADFPGTEKTTTIVFAFADGITYRR